MRDVFVIEKTLISSWSEIDMFDEYDLSSVSSKSACVGINLREVKFNLLREFFSEYNCSSLKEEIVDILFEYAFCNKPSLREGKLSARYTKSCLVNHPHVYMVDSSEISKLLFEIQSRPEVRCLKIIGNKSFNYTTMRLNTHSCEMDDRGSYKFLRGDNFIVAYEICYNEGNLGHFGIMTDNLRLNEIAYKLEDRIKEGEKLVIDSFVDRCRKVARKTPCP